MAVHRVSVEDFRNRVKLYQEIEKPYEVRKQGNSYELKVSDSNIGFYCYHARLDKSKNKEQMLPIKEVNFIGKVKKHIIDKDLHNSVGKRYEDDKDIKFIDINRNVASGEYFENCKCIDINSAYWKCALKLGYITDFLYNEGLTKDKRVRLASLGTFAKTINIIKFDGKEETFLDPILPTHPEVFFNCANMVFECMDACKKAAGDDFLFYWTDCVYVKNDNALNKCIAVLDKFGFDGRSEPVGSITFEDISIVVKDKKSKDKRYGITIKN